MLKTFLPLFAMTFFIVLFIVLMQFLWKYIDDLVGKGLSIDVLGELFFYAAVSMVPMALPLAILLASLMTFGNLGEKFELTAMKASGISVNSNKGLIYFSFLSFSSTAISRRCPFSVPRMTSLVEAMYREIPLYS